MGIRLTCPNGHKLHVKGFLAGKRGLCPECGVKVEIPGNGDSQGVLKPSVEQQAVATESGELSSSGSDPTPPPLDSAWYVRLPNGDQFGPVSEIALRQWAHQKRITADSLVWKEGWTEWRAAGEELELVGPVMGPLVGSAEPRPQKNVLPHSGPPGSEGRIEPSIQIDPVVPVQSSRDKSRRAVYFLLSVCLVLLVLMIYVLNKN